MTHIWARTGLSSFASTIQYHPLDRWSCARLAHVVLDGSNLWRQHYTPCMGMASLLCGSAHGLLDSSQSWLTLNRIDIETGDSHEPARANEHLTLNWSAFHNICSQTSCLWSVPVYCVCTPHAEFWRSLGILGKWNQFCHARTWCALPIVLFEEISSHTCRNSDRA